MVVVTDRQLLGMLKVELAPSRILQSARLSCIQNCLDSVAHVNGGSFTHNAIAYLLMAMMALVEVLSCTKCTSVV